MRPDKLTAVKPTPVRLAAPLEIEPALRLLLGSEAHLADPEIVRQFVADARERRLPLDRLRVAVEPPHMVWTILPMVSAGQTAVLVEPNRRVPRRFESIIQQLIAECCDDLRSSAVQLIQVLLDPDDAPAARLHSACGFDHLAMLEYVRLPAAPAAAPLPSGFELRTAPPDDDIAAALQLSYIDTLDCPRLNGLRRLPDIIDGYRHAHPYDPGLWHVLYRAGQPVGILLLSAPGPADPLELSYLGLAPAVRGRGLGATLVQLARSIAHGRGSAELAVTVDADNGPAKRLYFRAGGRVILQRRVMIRSM